MEKYSNTCKFILLCDQLAKIIEPLRSRCLLIRIPLPTEEQILETLLYISYKENISISIKDLYSIVKKSDYIINHAIWLLEMYTYKINYDNNWTNIIDDIVNLIYINKINTHKQLYNTMKKIREKFYLLFITNISTHLIIRKIMITLLYHINNINIKYNVIEITSIFEQRLNQGTRHIIQFEAYILKLIQLFTNNKKDNYKFKILSN
jgi:replication factor C subunit 3/5